MRICCSGAEKAESPMPSAIIPAAYEHLVSSLHADGGHLRQAGSWDYMRLLPEPRTFYWA